MIHSRKIWDEGKGDKFYSENHQPLVFHIKEYTQEMVKLKDYCMSTMWLWRVKFVFETSVQKVEAYDCKQIEMKAFKPKKYFLSK